MKKCGFSINGKDVMFSHDTDNNIARMFAQTIAAQENENHVIEDGKSIQIGWGYYVFKLEGKVFVVYAADYENDPFNDLTNDLTLSLNIMRDQLEICKKTGLMAKELITFQDTFMAKKSAVGSDNLYFEKQCEINDGDSGWYMGDPADEDVSEEPDDYETFPLYKLLEICPKAISLLSLPVGSIALVKNGEITNICDENNKEVYADQD